MSKPIDAHYTFLDVKEGRQELRTRLQAGEEINEKLLKLPADDWVRLRPRLAGICGSDLATVDGRASRYFEHIVSFPFVPGHEVVADTDDKAMAIARRAYLRWRASFTYLSELNGTLPQSPLRVDSFDTLIKQGQGIAGSPDTVRAFLGKQVEDSGVNYIVGQFCFGDLTLDEMLRSVDLFGKHVMPTLQKQFKS